MCVGRDLYGRLVGDCFRADGASVARTLVRGGHALNWPRYSHGAFGADQDLAKAKHRGVWRGVFELPWDLRARRAAAPEPPRLSSGPGPERQCLIKGNIRQSGERIYHVPGQRFYERTVIAAAKGERWFCTEEEARAPAGGARRNNPIRESNFPMDWDTRRCDISLID